MSGDISSYLLTVRAILRDLPADRRADFNKLWADLRNSLTAQEQVISNLQQFSQRGTTPLEPPARPQSSASVRDIRDAIDQALCEADDAQQVTSAFYTKLRSLSRA